MYLQARISLAVFFREEITVWFLGLTGCENIPGSTAANTTSAVVFLQCHYLYSIPAQHRARGIVTCSVFVLCVCFSFPLKSVVKRGNLHSVTWLTPFDPLLMNEYSHPAIKTVFFAHQWPLHRKTFGATNVNHSLWSVPTNSSTSLTVPSSPWAGCLSRPRLAALHRLPHHGRRHGALSPFSAQTVLPAYLRLHLAGQDTRLCRYICAWRRGISVHDAVLFFFDGPTFLYYSLLEFDIPVSRHKMPMYAHKLSS